MQFLVNVDTDDGTYRCVVNAGDDYAANTKARKYYDAEGATVYSCMAEMFNTFEHGDITDYEIL